MTRKDVQMHLSNVSTVTMETPHDSLTLDQLTSFLSLAKECADNAADGTEADWEENFWSNVGLAAPQMRAMTIDDFLKMFQDEDDRIAHNEWLREEKKRLEVEEQMAKRKSSMLGASAKGALKDLQKAKKKKKGPNKDDGVLKAADIVVEPEEDNSFIVEIVMGAQAWQQEQEERRQEIMRFYRPSTVMAMITPAVVDRLKTQHRKFAELYTEAMRPGYLEKPKTIINHNAAQVPSEPFSFPSMPILVCCPHTCGTLLIPSPPLPSSPPLRCSY
jgi:hypothetical protein